MDRRGRPAIRVLQTRMLIPHCRDGEFGYRRQAPWSDWASETRYPSAILPSAGPITPIDGNPTFRAVTFDEPGTYVLRWHASDGALWAKISPLR